MLFRKIYSFGDNLEDAVRGKLSHYPLTYAFVGGTGVIIFWRGVWHTIDYVMEFFIPPVIHQLPWWDGPFSMLAGAIILLTAGLFVTSFIGNEIIISGLKKEKKIVEKTEEELDQEIQEDAKINLEIHTMDRRLKRIEQALKKTH